MQASMKILFHLFFFLLLAGCMTTEPAFIPLPRNMPQPIKSSNLLILSIQDEIQVDIEKSGIATAMGGGLIPALIDMAVEKSRSTSAEEQVKPIRDVLIDFDIGQEFLRELGEDIDSIDWLQVKRKEVSYDKNQDIIQNVLATGTEDALILFTPHYSLSADFKQLKVETIVKVYPRSPLLRSLMEGENQKEDKPVPLYKNTYVKIMDLPTETSDGNTAAIEWSKNNGLQIKNSLNSSIKALAQLQRDGMNNPFQR